MAELREKYLMDKRSNEETIKEKALKQGLEQGTLNERIRIITAIMEGIPNTEALIMPIETLTDLDWVNQILNLVLVKDIEGVKKLLCLEE